MVTASTTIDASSESIPANSIIGKRLLSVARRVENNNNQEADMSWVAGYSLKPTEQQQQRQQQRQPEWIQWIV
jgi:hypothetical protein